MLCKSSDFFIKTRPRDEKAGQSGDLRQDKNAGQNMICKRRENSNGYRSGHLFAYYPSSPPGLLKFIEMENYLSDFLGIKVDLVMQEALKSGIGERILKEVTPA